MILVTGATGFVGPKIAHALRARDLPVRCLVRDRRRGATLESWGCELVEGDVTDAASLERAAAGCDVVVHLVAIITGRPEDFERVMAQGTRNLIAASREAGVRRFVLMSALGVNEQTKDLVPYFKAKWDMEHDLKSSGLEHVIFRPSFVFGRDGGVLPTFVKLARYAPVTPIIGPGTQRIQPIWVDDVAAYFAKGVDLPAAANRAFELGGPDAVTWNEFWARLKKILRKRRPSVHVPLGLMRVQAGLLERLPGAPITRDQLKMLAAGDNTCDMGPALETFELPVTPLDEQLRRAA
jgi:uncharacterized protein YbjT (DUF2867 family)